MNDVLKRKLLELGEGKGMSASYEGLAVQSTFEPPASVVDKISIETELQGWIPNDYLELCEIANGFTLFDYGDLDGFRFLSLGELKTLNDFTREMYAEDWDEKILVFCVVLGDGDYLALRSEDGGRYSILDGYHDAIPLKWNVIGASIDAFLNRLIDERGRKFYLQ